METIKKGTPQVIKPIGINLIERLWEESWVYIKTVIDVVREPVVILNKDLRIMAANEPFYQTFQVEAKDTEKKLVYELGDGQWDIPALRKLLEDVLPKHTFFKGFEVDHKFPLIGRKIMILNARQIHFKEDAVLPPIILLAMEDITEMTMVAEMLAHQTNQIRTELADQKQKSGVHIGKLEKEIIELKKNSEK